MQQYKRQSCDNVKGLFVGLKAQHTLPVRLVNPTYCVLCPPLAGVPKSAISRRGQKRLSDNKAIRQYVNKEILNTGNSCEPQRLMFQNDISKDEPFNHSTFHPFNKTSPSPACSTLPRGTFVEPFTPHSSRFTRRKSAFTLAEVLITLGIIGVVAAMTLPALINKTQHQELQTGLKKNYTVLQQALLRAQLDTGEVVKPANYQKVEGVTKGSPLKKLLTKYIKNAQDCGGGTEKGSCIENASITGNENAKNPYKTFNGKNSVIPNWLDDGQFITTDGTLFLLESAMGDGSTVYPILITVDVNGVQKRPNRWGYDLFTFQLTDSGKLLPVGAEGTSYTDMAKYCSLTNTSNQNGVGCTYKALTDKDYWKNLK